MVDAIMMEAQSLQTERLRTPDDILPGHLLDGLAVTSACVSRALNIQLYPDQVLIASSLNDEDATLAFVQGVPDSVSLSEITFLQERPMRRNLHQRSRIPVPIGTSFTLRQGVDNARAFIQKLGFPVVLKPATGSASTEMSPRIDDWDTFDAALARLRQSPETRPGYVQMLAGPANTNWHADDAGQSIAPRNYRIVVEQYLSGQYLRCLLIDGKVVSVVRCTEGPWSPNTQDFEDVTQATSGSICDLAERALKILPRIPIAAVDIVATDHTLAVPDQPAHVVEVSERPWLYVQKQVANSLFEHLGDELVRQDAASKGVVLEDPLPHRAISFSVSGLRGASGLGGAAESVLRLARQLSLTGWIDPLDQSLGAAGELRGHVRGHPLAIATLSQALLGDVLDDIRCISFGARQGPDGEPSSSSLLIG